MTATLEIRNPEPLKTGSKAALSVELDTQGDSQLFMIVPLGDGGGALMTPGEFTGKLQLSIAKADGAQPTPDARFGSPERRVDSANKSRGIIQLARRKPSLRERFCVLFEDFTTNAAAGSAELRLEDKDQKSLAARSVTIAGAQPRIIRFVSTAYNLLSGEEATLSWEISPPGGIRLRRLSDDADIKPEAGGQTAKVEAGTGDFTRYRLDAMAGEKVTDSRVLTLFSYDYTRVRSYAGPGNQPDLGLSCAEILGVYNRRNRLYAVVRDADPQKGASIWSSDIGFDPSSWRPLTVERNGKPTPVMIPAEAATRPGVVFDDKLYFMGGSSYDANLPGTDVGYYHFEASTWVDGEAVRKEAWPEDLTARMGHGLLASPDGSRLWVLGGYNGDGGALNDVWAYDKATAKWQRHPALWEPRCLFGATFAGPGRRELWIAGGFDSPGGYPTYDDIWHCDTTATNLAWSKLDYPLSRDPGNRIKQYRGCALAALGDGIYALAAYHDVDQGLRNFGLPIGFSNNRWIAGQPDEVGSDWVTGALDCYRFDATVLGGGIFVRQLYRAEGKDKQIHYLVRVQRRGQA